MCACVRARSREGAIFADLFCFRKALFLPSCCPTFLSRAVIAHIPLTWAKDRFSTPRSARRPEVRFFFFFWIKAFGLQCLLGLPVCSSFSLCKHSTVHAVFPLQERGFFFPASPITCPEVSKDTGEKPSFFLYLKRKTVSSS